MKAGHGLKPDDRALLESLLRDVGPRLFAYVRKAFGRRLDAEEIVAAYVTLSWDSPVDYTLNALDASFDGIERALRREADSTTSLPWGPDDDWDVPLATDESSSRGQTPRRCFIVHRA